MQYRRETYRLPRPERYVHSDPLLDHIEGSAFEEVEIQFNTFQLFLELPFFYLNVFVAVIKNEHGKA